MVGADHEAAGSCYGHGDWDRVVCAVGSGEALGNDFIRMEEVGVVEGLYSKLFVRSFLAADFS